jgi:hypothetical protein
MADWDGLVGWLIDYASAHPEALGNTSVKQWWRAAQMVMFP